jgi:hypothetical protein
MLVIGVVVAVFWARSTVAELGDTTPTAMERSFPVGGTELAEAAAPGDRGAAVPAAGNPAESKGPLRLTIDLQEGQFTIRPGPPGGQVQVQGRFAPGIYELTENHDTETDGTRRSIIRFRSKAPMWARILSGMGDSGDRPELTVLIPSGSPLNLSLRVSMGESRVDLGGLALDELDLDFSMGEHRLDFGQPLTMPLRRVRVDTNMGNVSLENFGNARPEAVETSASMGNLTADLGGQWPEGYDASFTFSQSMGELTLRVPSSIRLDSDFRNNDGEEQRRTVDNENPKEPNAPRLRLRVLSSMGESRVIRY